jgi:hypothetical protein
MRERYLSNDSDSDSCTDLCTDCRNHMDVRKNRIDHHMDGIHRAAHTDHMGRTDHMDRRICDRNRYRETCIYTYRQDTHNDLLHSTHLVSI